MRPGVSSIGGQDKTGKKTCPRCGEVLYADMGVCYGCLYDFSREDNGPSELAVPLDEPEPEPGEGLSGGLAVGQRGRRGPAPSLPGIGPQASGEALEDDEATTVLGDARPLAPRPPCAAWLQVTVPDLETRVPVGARGLCIGRGGGNDVVLRDRAVSRRHLRLVPAPEGFEAIDLGSTNPARFEGRPIETSLLVPWGGEIELGRAVLVPVRAGTASGPCA